MTKNIAITKFNNGEDIPFAKTKKELTEYDKLGCLQGILDIKEHYSYFLDSIIK
jgi:hypothetical protein